MKTCPKGFGLKVAKNRLKSSKADEELRGLGGLEKWTLGKRTDSKCKIRQKAAKGFPEITSFAKGGEGCLATLLYKLI